MFLVNKFVKVKLLIVILLSLPLYLFNLWWY